MPININSISSSDTLKFALILSLFFTAFSKSFSQEIKFEETPKWVVKKEIPTNSEVGKFDVSSGVYPTLYDNQINLKESAQYMHFGLNVLTYGGTTNASEISITFDSSYQSLIFHKLHIWRDNKKVDKTESITFEMLNNEDQLQSGIYSGKVTAYEILEDIRKGDIIEYSYTIIGNNPIFKNNDFDIITLEGDNPVDELFVRIIYSENSKLIYECNGCDSLSLSNNTINDSKELVVSGKNIKAIEVEETAPSYFVQYNYLSFSSYGSWKDVEDWATEVFNLEEEQNIESVYDEIWNTGDDTLQMITSIFDFVQDDIRYMGIESGIGSHQPFPPEQVIKQRFGDCKDKSLLATTLLKKIGIQESYPVLVSSYLTKGLDRFLPAGQLFDHCIVYFEYKGTSYWVDPTIPQQGATIEHMQCPDFGKVLIVGKKKNQLTEMGIIDTTSKVVVVEDIDVSSFTESGSLKVTTKFYGLEADRLRGGLDFYSINELSDFYKQGYSNIFPRIETTETLKIVDDIENNILTVVENYKISENWNFSENENYKSKTFSYEPLVLYSYVSNLACEKIEYPVFVNFPSNITLKTTLSYPDKLNVDDVEINTQNEVFSYSKNMTLTKNNQLQLDYSFYTKADEIATENFNQICNDINTLVRDLPFKIYYNEPISLNYSSTFKKRKSRKEKKQFDDILELLQSSQTDSLTNKDSINSPINEKDEHAKTYVFVEEMPQFPGGHDSLMNYISVNMKYPEWEKKSKIEGTVYAKYIVNELGNTENPEILVSVNGSINFDAEVIRLIENMPKWKPGKEKGEFVKVQYTLPVQFIIKSELD